MDKGKDDVSLLALSNMGAVCYNSITLYCSIHFRIYMHLHVILYATDQFRLCSFCMLLMSRAISSESSESSTSRTSARGFESSEDPCSNSSLEREALLDSLEGVLVSKIARSTRSNSTRGSARRACSTRSQPWVLYTRVGFGQAFGGCHWALVGLDFGRPI